MLCKWWRARQRAIDVKILWPVIRDAANGLDDARLAFAVHAAHDTAWIKLGYDEIARQIKELK